MHLENQEQRHELINDLIDKAFEFREVAVEYEDDNDWGCAKVVLDYLIDAERLICTEEIFMNGFYSLGRMRYPDRDEIEHLQTIFLLDGVHVFAHEVLLRNLEYTLKTLNTWGLRTESGEEFRAYVSERLEQLIKTYKFLYTL